MKQWDEIIYEVPVGIPVWEVWSFYQLIKQLKQVVC